MTTTVADLWTWSPVERGGADGWVFDWIAAMLGSDRLEQVSTEDVDPDEIDVFAAEFLQVKFIANCIRQDDVMLVHSQCGGVEYVYFEENNGDVAGFYRVRA
jgi:hypothetical protein